MASIRRVTPETSAGIIRPAGYDVGSNTPNYNSLDTNRESFGGSTTADPNLIAHRGIGEFPDDMRIYDTAYNMMKDYPQWLSLLDANPWFGFEVPESMWDSIGLSNKQKEKMQALQANYRQYISDVILKFMSWQNSLPSTQREQAVEAGYNADLLDFQQSSIDSDGIKTDFNPFSIESEDTGKQIFSGIRNCLGVILSCVNGGFAVAQGVGQLHKLYQDTERSRLDNERQSIDNYMNAYRSGKELFGSIAPKPTHDENSITPSSKIVLSGAPSILQNAVDSYQDSRDYETQVKQSISNSVKSSSDVVESEMVYDQVSILYGTPEVWKDLRKMYNEAQSKQISYVRDYYDTVDAVKAAYLNNTLVDKQQDYVDRLNMSSSASVFNASNNVALKNFDFQLKTFDSKLKMMETRRKIIDSLFDAAENSNNKWKRISAQTALLGIDFGSEYFGYGMPSNGSTGVPSVPTLSMPQIPALSPIR